MGWEWWEPYALAVLAFCVGIEVGLIIQKAITR